MALEFYRHLVFTEIFPVKIGFLLSLTVKSYINSTRNLKVIEVTPASPEKATVVDIQVTLFQTLLPCALHILIFLFSREFERGFVPTFSTVLRKK